jgi:hypothetical protein
MCLNVHAFVPVCMYVACLCVIALPPGDTEGINTSSRGSMCARLGDSNLDLTPFTRCLMQNPMQDQPCGDTTAGPCRQQVPPTRPAPLLIQQDRLPAVRAMLHGIASRRATQRNRRGKVGPVCVLCSSCQRGKVLCKRNMPFKHAGVRKCVYPAVELGSIAEWADWQWGTHM